MFRKELVEALSTAAAQVLQEMLGTNVEAVGQRVETSVLRAEDVTVLVGLTGEVSGVCLLSMPMQTALGVVGVMMGEAVESLDQMGLSAIGELGNMIAGAATIQLEGKGISSNITPPSVVQGRSPEITIPNLERTVVSLNTGLGGITLHLSVKG